MDTDLKEIIWKQFGASIDMLENAITMCPDNLWDTGSKFWHNAYHALFFLDYYLTEDEKNFMPPPPFTLSEFEDGVMPDRIYSKEELLTYLNFCRKKCYDLVASLTPEGMRTRRFTNEYRDYNIIEILIYNMRHVQHHTAQLNLLLRQGMNDAPKWVSRTKVSL